MGGGGGGWDAQLFSYLGSLFQYCWGGGVQKNEVFLGNKDFVDFFFFFLGGGSLQNWTLCICGSFLKVKVQNGDSFWVAKISNIFLRCLKFLIFLG